MSNFDEWLALHHLTKEDVMNWHERWFDVVGRRRQDNSSEDAQSRYCLDVEDVSSFVSDTIIPAYHLVLGVPWSQLRQALALSRWTLRDHPAYQSFARWDGRAKEVEVHLRSVDGSVNPLTVAHEFFHVLQALETQSRVVPPVLREVGAFVGELALIGFEAGVPAVHRRQYRQIWKQENQFYVEAAGALLDRALKQPKHPYHYRMNYPLARFIALVATQDWATVPALAQQLIHFTNQDDGLALLHTAMQVDLIGSRAIAPPHHGQHPWTQMHHAFAAVLGLPADSEFLAGSEATICCLYADAPQPFAILQSQGKGQYVCRCAYDARHRDWLRLGGVFAQAIRAHGDQSDSNQSWAERAGQAVARHAWPSRISERDDVSLRLQADVGAPVHGSVRFDDLINIAPQALAAMFAGLIDWQWLQPTVQVKSFESQGAAEGDLHGDSTRQTRDHVQDALYRSRGIHAIAGLMQADTGISIQAFVLTHTGGERLGSRPIPRDHFWVLGLMLTALSTSDYHQRFSVHHYMRVELLPAIQRQHFWCFLTNGQDPGFVTWAWVSPKVEAALHQHGDALAPEDWQSGNRLFFNDWVAPAPLVRTATRFIAHDIFPEALGTSLRRNPDASVRKINRWKGASYRQSGGRQQPLHQPCPGSQWLLDDPTAMA